MTSPFPVMGEVVITEVMQNPATLLDDDGEYFELTNLTGSTLRLAGCQFEGDGDNGFTAMAGLEIAPYGTAVFATDSAVYQGFTPVQQWPAGDYNLGNSSDLIRMICGGVVIDEVAWDNGATFPDPNGASMNLDPNLLDAVNNDTGSSWCESTSSFNGDLGTPGAANDPCIPPTTYTVDFCRLQFPTAITDTIGTPVDVFGRLYIAGLTDLSGVNDPAPEVLVQAGWGPDGSDPTVGYTWSWTAGSENPGYGPASPGYEANNDEYGATLTLPGPAGDYDFAVRFSGDSGSTWTVCDNGYNGAGSSDGYDPADAGQMTTQAGAALPLFFSEYAEGGSNNKALEIFNPSGSDVDLTTCEIRLYFGGSTSVGNTIGLSGLVAPGDTYVVCDDGIDPAVYDPANCDLLDNGSFFNGDDAVELVCNGTLSDSIGQVGFDPGSEWNVNNVGTQNETLRRLCLVSAGDADSSDVFDPSLEWSSATQDDFSDFGQHVLCTP